MNNSASFSARAPRPAASGFTILEMVVVIAIIGLILGVVVSRVGNVFGDSEQKVAQIFVSDSLKMPLMRYRMDFGSYPTTSEGIAALISAPSVNAERWRGPYLDSPGGKLPLDPWKEPYQYRFPGTKNPGGYDVFSKGPDRVADTADDIGNW